MLVWRGKPIPRHTPHRFFITVGRGPVPRHASIGTGNGLGRWTIFARVGRSRGTGPRATMKKRVYRRARACPSPCLDRNGEWPWSVDDFRAGRAIAGETLSPARMAGEGPRATVKKRVYRSARACPSPCLVTPFITVSCQDGCLYPPAPFVSFSGERTHAPYVRRMLATAILFRLVTC